MQDELLPEPRPLRPVSYGPRSRHHERRGEVDPRGVASQPLPLARFGGEENAERAQQHTHAPHTSLISETCETAVQPRPGADNHTLATPAPTSAGAGSLGRAASTVTMATISTPPTSTPLNATGRAARRFRRLRARALTASIAPDAVRHPGDRGAG